MGFEFSGFGRCEKLWPGLMVMNFRPQTFWENQSWCWIFSGTLDQLEKKKHPYLFPAVKSNVPSILCAFLWVRRWTAKWKRKKMLTSVRNWCLDSVSGSMFSLAKKETDFMIGPSPGYCIFACRCFFSQKKHPENLCVFFGSPLNSFFSTERGHVFSIGLLLCGFCFPVRGSTFHYAEWQ